MGMVPISANFLKKKIILFSYSLILLKIIKSNLLEIAKSSISKIPA